MWHLGFSEVFKDAFAEVHANNMDKYWSYEEYCESENGLSLDGMKWEHVEGRGYICRRADSKIVKPPHHAKVDLRRFV